MGQIWDFLRSVSVHFGAVRQNVLILILKSPRFVASQTVLKLILKIPKFVPFGANMALLGANPEIPVEDEINLIFCIPLH